MADLHIHSLYSDGTMRIRDILDHVERHTTLDLIAITDHERIDGALRAREIHAAGGYSFELIVGEEITTRSGHLLALFLEERVRPLRSLEYSLQAVHEQGGLAIVPHPMSQLTLSVGRGSFRRLARDSRPGVHLDGIELINPSGAGRSAHAAVRRMNEEVLHLPGIGSSDAHVLGAIGSAFTWFAGTRADDFRAALDVGAVEPQGGHWSAWQNVAIYRRQLAAKARHLRHALIPGGEWR
ncbi:MAG: PHP domain-containing protein [Chloroflexota bacterium]|nr:PHP domain-containing protein [Chloroflexota bacterium]